MRKTTYKIDNFKYTFDSEVRGAKYTWEYKGVTYKGNGGDFSEAGLKWCRGYEPIKDANTSYAVGSDIEEDGTSVKTWGFTLASACTGESFEEVIDKFFQNVHSWNFSFVIIIENELTDYNMNADEFRQFLYRFASYDKGRKVIRGPKASLKKIREVVQWFEG